MVRRGRVYLAPLADVDPKARIPNAPVRFRIVRADGEESAAEVRLRAGTRTTPSQRRFGDLSGARRPGTKVVTAAAAYGIDTASPPFAVVDAWLEAMAAHDLDGAAALYRPDATVHLAAEDATGHHHIRAALDRCPLSGLDPDHADVYGLGRYVRTDIGGERPGYTSSFIVERGSIIEQWIGIEPPADTKQRQPTPIQVVVIGPVGDAARDYAERRFRHLIDTVGRPVRFSRLKLTAVDNPSSERPALAEAVLDLDRKMIRAHVDAPTFTEAADRVVERLQARIGHERSRRRSSRRGGTTIREWVDEMEADSGPRRRSFVADPVDRPEIVRHRSFAPEELTVDEAAWDLVMLDYEFLLFVEVDSGDDAILERADDSGFVLHFRGGVPDMTSPMPPGVIVADRPLPRSTVAEAVDVMIGTDDRYRFFVDRDDGRAKVVHRRLDGHVGLITPP